MSMFYQVKTVVSGYLAVGSKRVTPYFLRSKDSTWLTKSGTARVALFAA